ncbi:MAG: phosphoribosyltransferase family protein [Mucinivorans sp.]
MKIHDIDFEPYITADVVQKAIVRVADQINDQYADSAEPVVLLVTLSGAMVFAGELCRHITVPVELAFVKCSSYGEQTTSSGRIAFEVEPTASLLGREVIVLEDIVDTGNTWLALHTYIDKQGAHSIRIATMLCKREIYSNALPLDFVGLDVVSEFLVGYGLDYNQLGRNINGIYKEKKVSGDNQ